MERIFLVCIALMLVAGCSKDQDKELVGKWQETKDPRGALIFLADHQGRAYWPSDSGGQDSSPMTWSVNKEGSQLTAMTPQGPVIFEIKGDRLIAPNGLELKKMQ